MKTKHLYIMAAILIGLIALTIVSETKPETESIEEQAGYETLVPDSLSTEAITAMELSLGASTPKEAKETEAPTATTPNVRLVKLSEGGWTVASAWNAPADAEKIETFLSTLKKMKGEFVSDREPMQADYQVNETTGIHLKLFTAAGSTPAFDLFIGKKRGWDQTLVRLAGQKKIYAIGSNLRSDLGVMGDTDAPKHTAWLQKKMTELNKDLMRKVEVSYPDHVLVFENVEKPAKKEEPKSTEAQPTKESKKEYEWKLVSGGPGGDFKKNAWNSMLGAASSFETADIIDPAKKKELGLDEPTYRCLVTMADGSTHEIMGVRSPKEDKAYAILAAAPERIYSISTWTFDHLFKPGKDLFDLKTPTWKKDKILSLKLTRGKQIFQVTRKDKNSEWTLATPATGFKINATVATDIAEALSSWSAHDFTDAKGMVQFGFSLPTCVLEAGLTSGKTEILLLGLPHPGHDGVYVANGETERALVMEQKDAKKIFPALETLLDLSTPLLNAKKEAVLAVTVAPRGQPPFTLKATRKEKEPVAWSFIQGAASVPADPKAAEALLDALLSLKASAPLDETAAENALVKEALSTITLDMGKTTCTLTLGAKAGDGIAARSSTETLAVSVNAFDTKALFPDTKTLKAKPAEKVKTEAPSKDKKPAAVTKTIKNPFEEKKGTPEEK